jgi:A/G-specific adenine glycosylase
MQVFNLFLRVFNQQLTHQKIKGQFIKVVLPTIPKALKNNQWLSVNEVNQLAFPKFINQFLEEKETQGLLF